MAQSSLLVLYTAFTRYLGKIILAALNIEYNAGIMDVTFQFYVFRKAHWAWKYVNVCNNTSIRLSPATLMMR